jgi:hypothetical protein
MPTTLQPVASACNAPRADGRPCTSTIVRASGYCHMHDPERQAGLGAVRQAGGHARSTTARSSKHLPPELRTVQTALLELVAEVRAGTATPQEAMAVATICGRLVELTRLSLELGETRALAERIAALEAASGEVRRYMA